MHFTRHANGALIMHGLREKLHWKLKVEFGNKAGIQEAKAIRMIAKNTLRLLSSAGVLFGVHLKCVKKAS